jgi:digeranylgeranylglycerophospholipid reductase
VYRLMPPIFSTGRVKQFKVGNMLLSGRAAGLTERVLGIGAFYALVSGTLAARAAIQNIDYESEMRKLQNYIESISSFRKVINKFDNNDFDKLVSLLGTPVIKQMLYNTEIDFSGLAGSILKQFNKS